MRCGRGSAEHGGAGRGGRGGRGSAGLGGPARRRGGRRKWPGEAGSGAGEGWRSGALAGERGPGEARREAARPGRRGQLSRAFPVKLGGVGQKQRRLRGGGSRCGRVAED